MTASQHDSIYANVSEYLAMVGVTMVFVAGWLAAGGLLSNYNEITGGGGTGGHQRHLGSQHPHLLCSPCSRHLTPDSGDRDENSVFILYIYLFSTFIDLALIRYNTNMLQKTDNPLNIV